MKTVINSSDKSSLNITEIKNSFGLLKYLALRDVTVRYKQTILGIAWSVIRPAVNILIFGSLSVILNSEKSVTDNFLIVSACVIFWQFQSSIISDVSNSLVSNANILTKVYFPKIILPLSSMYLALIDFVISFFIFILLYFLIRGGFALSFLALPLAMLYGVFFSFSLGLLFSASSVKFRDVRFVLPFLIQLLFYATPVFISSEKMLSYNLPHLVKIIYQINPMVQIMNLYRYCFTGIYESFNFIYLLISVFISIILGVLSIKLFLKLEGSFADHI